MSGYPWAPVEASAETTAPAVRHVELEPRERFVTANGVELCYEDAGDPDGEPLLLVMGLGTQLIHWSPALVNLLADRGFRTIRFDNRDAGHSEKIDAPKPGLIPMLLGLD